ncbi:MAG: SLC13 family permease [Brevefilum sp.]|nr:SLC13 family permease [Brevefilum sp.]
MTPQIATIYLIIVISLILFAINRWRYDVISLLVLIVIVLFGLIPAENAFLGFSNSAVITVAAVLVLTKGLQNSGLVEMIGEQLVKLKGGIMVQLAALTGIVTFLSAIMNNVGAVALLMPVAIHIARKKEIPVSLLLMPMAFAAHFGGMSTLIGTPTNLITSSFREEAIGIPYQMFDFTLLGVGLSIASILAIVFIGWRLIPTRKGRKSAKELFNIEAYITEVKLPESSPLVGLTLKDIGRFSENHVHVLSVVRKGERRVALPPDTVFLPNDILLIRTDTEHLETLLTKTGLELVGSRRIEQAELETSDMTVMEVVIKSNSMLENNSAFGLDLRRRYGVNLLAVSRQGSFLRTRLDRIRLKTGDVLLLQGHPETLRESLQVLGCLPLAERGLRIGRPKRIILTLIIFVSVLLLAGFNVMSVSIAFALGVVLMVMAKLVTLKEAYESVDWPVIILIGTQIPIGEALESTGGAQLIAETILGAQNWLPPIWMLILVLIVTMGLSDIVKNAAAVVLMAPIVISLAQGLGVSIDPFLMAIIVGSSSAFLTPFGHQSNVLVMGPGGYKFGDYWKMGLLLEAVVLAVGIPLILMLFPF